MNRIKFAMRRLVRTLMLVAALISGGVFGLYKMRVDIPLLNTPKIYAYLDSMSKMRVDIPLLNTPKIYTYLDSMGMRANQMKEYIVGQYESRFHKHEEEARHEPQKIVVTSPMAKDVIITQEYVCQIHSQRHINVCALEGGYLVEIAVKGLKVAVAAALTGVRV